MTRIKDLKRLHKYYKQKVADMERDRDFDRSSEMCKILREHKKLKLFYKTEIEKCKAIG